MLSKVLMKIQVFVDYPEDGGSSLLLYETTY